MNGIKGSILSMWWFCIWYMVYVFVRRVRFHTRKLIKHWKADPKCKVINFGSVREIAVIGSVGPNILKPLFWKRLCFTSSNKNSYCSVSPLF